MFGFRRRSAPTGLTRTDVASVTNAIDNYTWTMKSIWNSLNPFRRSIAGEQMKANCQNSALYAGLSMYAWIVPTIPRYMARIDSASGAVTDLYSTTDHPAARVWKHMAGSHTADVMVSLMAVDLRWDGNFYALPQWNGSGQINGLFYINPSRIPPGAIRYANGGEDLLSRQNGRMMKASRDQLIVDIMSGDRMEEKKTLTIPYSELFHIASPLMDTANHRGMGARDHALMALGIASNAEDYIADFYKSGIRKQMFLGTEKDISPNVIAQLEKLLLKGSDDENTGNAKQQWPDRDLGDFFRARILPNGLKPIFAGQMLSDLQFIETRAFSNEDIARFIQIPPGLLYAFMGQGATPDSLEGMLFNWQTTSLGPFMSWIGSGFRDAVLPVSSRPLFEFGFNRIHLLKTTPQAGSVTVRNMIEAGLLTQEEGREVFGIRTPRSVETTYVPANIITKKHSDLLEQKVQQTIELGQVQIDKLKADMERAEETFEAMKNGPGLAPMPAPSAPADGPGKKPASSGPESTTKPAGGKEDPTPKPNKATNSLLVARSAFLAVLNGLHEFELRYAKPKFAATEHSVDIRTAAKNWFEDKFAGACNSHVDLWQTVDMGYNVCDIMEDWILNSSDIVSNSPNPVSDLEEAHRVRIASLLQKEIPDENPGA